MTFVCVDGFEHGVFSTAGTGLYDAVGGGTFTSDASTIAPGGSKRSVHNDATVAGGQLQHSISGTPALLVAQIRFRIPSTINTGGATSFWALTTIGGGTAFLAFDGPSNRIRFDNSVNALPGVVGTPTLNTWHLVSIRADISANPWVLDWSYDNIAQSQLTPANPAETFANTVCGIQAGGIGNWDMWFDDWLVTNVSGDYPLDHVIPSYVPNAVGTHSLDASPSSFFFQHDGATATALTNSETTSFGMIDEAPIASDSARNYVAPGTATTSIALQGSNNAAAATITIPTHASGDLIVISAYVASNTAATIPTAGGTVPTWTTVQTGGANTTSLVTVATIATASNHTSGTFTTATNMVVHVYRGTNGTLAIGASSTGNANNSTNITYPALTLQNANSTSTVYRVGCRSAAATTVDDPPTSYTFEQGSPSGGTSAVASFDRTSVAANPTADNVAQTSAAYRAHSFEVKITPTTTEPGATQYAEWQFADEGTLSTVPVAVRAILALNQDSANATGTVTARLYDGTNTEDIVTALSVNSATTIYKSALLNQKPNTSGAWTLAALNALRLRYGLTATADGVMRLEGAVLEAVFPDAVVGPGLPWLFNPVPFQAIPSRPS